MIRERFIGRGVPFVPILVVVLLVVVLVGGCGGESSSSGEEVEEQDATEQTTESTEQSGEQSTPSVGDAVTMGDVQWTVREAQYSDILVSRLGTEEGDFIIVDVDFTNNSNQDITLATPFVTLVDSEGNEYEADIERNFLHVEPERNLFVDHVEPGGTKEGRIIYSIPNNAASGFKLRVGEARFASDETQDIDLGL